MAVKYQLCFENTSIAFRNQRKRPTRCHAHQVTTTSDAGTLCDCAPRLSHCCGICWTTLIRFLISSYLIRTRMPFGLLLGYSVERYSWDTLWIIAECSMWMLIVRMLLPFKSLSFDSLMLTIWMPHEKHMKFIWIFRIIRIECPPLDRQDLNSTTSRTKEFLKFSFLYRSPSIIAAWLIIII